MMEKNKRKSDGREGAVKRTVKERTGCSVRAAVPTSTGVLLDYVSMELPRLLSLLSTVGRFYCNWQIQCIIKIIQYLLAT